MKLVNDRTGQFRTVSFGGALAGTLFLGPIYLLFKGVWTWGLLSLAVNIVLCAIHPLLGFLSWLIWAAAASTMIESFYKQRGFDVPENRSRTVASPPPLAKPSPQPSLRQGYSFAEDRLLQIALLLPILAALFAVVAAARAQTYSAPSETIGASSPGRV